MVRLSKVRHGKTRTGVRIASLTIRRFQTLHGCFLTHWGFALLAAGDTSRCTSVDNLAWLFQLLFVCSPTSHWNVLFASSAFTWVRGWSPRRASQRCEGDDIAHRDQAIFSTLRSLTIAAVRRSHRIDPKSFDLTTPCAECGYKIHPNELMRLDGERVRCPACKLDVLVPTKKKQNK